MSKNHQQEAEDIEKTHDVADNVAENLMDEGSLSEKTSEQDENVSDNQNEPAPENEFEKKYKDLYDKHLRLTAEYDNYRKRTLKEKSDLLKYGSENALKNLLTVIDDIERAVSFIQTSTDIEAIKEGIILINSKFAEYLGQNGVKAIDTMGAEFNVDIHEAVTKIPSEDMKGKVVDVLQKGYYLNDKVIRYSKVVVGE